MKYTAAKIKRVFVVKIENGDDVLESLYSMARREKVKSGMLYLIGAIDKCEVVTGPRKTVLPPDPWFVPVKGAHEVVGIGTLFSEKGKPRIHLHMSLGRGRKAMVGCLRKNSKTYIVLEGVLMELESKAVRALDGKSGMTLLKI